MRLPPLALLSTLATARVVDLAWLAASAVDANAASMFFKASFSTASLGASTIATNTLTIAGSEYHGLPEPLTRVTVHFPPGVGNIGPGLATCEPTVNAECPPASFAGPQSSVTMHLPIGSEAVEEIASLQPVFTPSGGIDFVLRGHTPAAVEVSLVATYTPGLPPSGPVLDVTVPLIQAVPGAAYASITDLTLALGASRREAGAEFNSLTLPKECPPSGRFAWLDSATFDDATTSEAIYQSSCPQPGPAPPIVGQSQTVSVTRGKVAIRPRGATSFVPLTGASTIPDGSEIDASSGQVSITAAKRGPHHTQSAEISGGRLVIHQDRANAAVHLALSLPLTGCSGGSSSTGSSATATSGAGYRARPRSRHLWVSDTGGAWGTNGRYVSTAVRGTRWLTVDECERSRVEVTVGKVRVHDLIHHTSRTISAGETYTATRRPLGTG